MAPSILLVASLLLPIAACGAGSREETSQIGQPELTSGSTDVEGDGGATEAPPSPESAGHAEAETPGTTAAAQSVNPKVVTTPTAVTFPSEDGLMVTADLYLAYEDQQAPFIVLFHQAGWSRGEYREIAPRLNALGYNCLAVDQRSGGKVNGVANETAKGALAKKLGTTYLDAIPDLRASLKFARATYAKARLVGWGSSYSSALVLWLAGEEPGLMDVALAFAPGEYFARFGKSKSFVESAAKKIAVPVFVTSAKDEAAQWSAIYAAIGSPLKAQYLPPTAGNHGSRALWASFADSPGYWDAVEAFLGSLK